TLSAAFGQFGRDARHLMRTEIAEVREQFQEGQVGSSTMAHKRNPINFESLEGMWLRTRKEFLGVTDTLISEHQRDLVGSSLMRDFPIIVVNLTQQLNTLLRKGKEDPRPFLERLIIDPEACERNFALSSGVILAEPLYLALQMAGYEGDAHGFVNDKAMPLSQKKGILLIEATEELARDNAEVRAALEAIPGDVRRLFAYPHEYTGKARDKALEVARAAREFFEAA
ncbi:MAG: lyase family protein, partial [bacterium]|nr:lyase family protein [bacterium]